MSKDHTEEVVAAHVYDRMPELRDHLAVTSGCDDLDLVQPLFGCIVVDRK